MGAGDKRVVTNTEVYHDIDFVSKEQLESFLDDLHRHTEHMKTMEDMQDVFIDDPGMPVHATDVPHLRERSRWDLLDLAVTTLQGDSSPKTSLETFLEHAQTGDVVLFANHDLTSYLQRILAWSHYTHAVIVLRNPRDGRVYLLESSSSVADIPDLEREETHDGLSLVPASSCIAQYAVYWGNIYWRKLHIVGSNQYQKEVTQRVAESIVTVYNEWKDVGYDGHTFLQTSVAANFISRYTALMLPRCVGNYFNGNGHGSICSCIVAEVLMRAEVMNSRRSPYEYPPEAFGERNNDIELIPTVKLGDVEEIIPYKWNDKQYWDKRMKSYTEKFDVVRRGIGGFLYKLNLHA